MTKLKCSVTVRDQKPSVTTAGANVDDDVLRCVCNELDYRTDMCM